MDLGQLVVTEAFEYDLEIAVESYREKLRKESNLTDEETYEKGEEHRQKILSSAKSIWKTYPLMVMLSDNDEVQLTSFPPNVKYTYVEMELDQIEVVAHVDGLCLVEFNGRDGESTFVYENYSLRSLTEEEEEGEKYVYEGIGLLLVDHYNTCDTVHIKSNGDVVHRNVIVGHINYEWIEGRTGQDESEWNSDEIPRLCDDDFVSIAFVEGRIDLLLLDRGQVISFGWD
jgi:hypothetical protein